MRSMLSSLLPSRARTVIAIGGAVVGLYAAYRLVNAQAPEPELKPLPQAVPENVDEQERIINQELVDNPVPVPQNRIVHPEEKKPVALPRESKENIEEVDSKDSLEEFFSCPISGDVMKDPVTTIAGQTYEREEIKEWLSGHDTDPHTSQEIKWNEKEKLIPNFFAKSLIEEFSEKKISLDHLANFLICPITLELMEDPVLTSTGKTYEREAIAKWFEVKSSDPVNGHQRVTDKRLIPNYFAKSLIAEFKKRQENAARTAAAPHPALPDVKSQAVAVPHARAIEQKIMPPHIDQGQRRNDILKKLNEYATAEGFIWTVRKHYQLPAAVLLSELRQALSAMDINPVPLERIANFKIMMTNILRRDPNKSGSDFDKALRSAWNKIIDFYPEIAAHYPKLPEKRNNNSMYQDFLARGGRQESIPGFIENDPRYAFR